MQFGGILKFIKILFICRNFGGFFRFGEILQFGGILRVPNITNTFSLKYTLDFYIIPY